MDRPYKPYRLGRKQERVILDDSGLEVAIFHERSKHLAKKVVNFLNEYVTGRKLERDVIDEYFNSGAYEMQRNRVNEIYERRIRYAPYAILDNKYQLGIDPIDGNSESKAALIRSDGTIQQLPKPDLDFYDEMLRLSEYYNCSVIVENGMTLDFTIRIKMIKEQSKLNVIKYKR